MFKENLESLGLPKIDVTMDSIHLVKFNPYLLPGSAKPRLAELCFSESAIEEVYEGSVHRGSRRIFEDDKAAAPMMVYVLGSVKVGDEMGLIYCHHRPINSRVEFLIASLNHIETYTPLELRAEERVPKEMNPTYKV